MIYNGQELVFPTTSKVSFYKLFETLEEQAKDADPNVAEYAQHLLKELEPYPLLKEGFEDLSLLTEYRPQIEKLLRPIFPDALSTNEIKGITAPFSFTPFFTSVRFANILKNAGKGFQLEIKEFNEDEFYIAGCTMVLGSYFRFPVDLSRPFTFQIPNEKLGTSRYYRIAFNADLMEILPTDKSIDITEEDYRLLLDNFDNVELWKEKFPPDSWILRGVGILNLMDVTMDQSMNSITSTLLNKSSDTPELIEQNLQKLFNLQDLKISFVTIKNGSFWQEDKSHQMSIMLGGADSVKCEDAMCEMGYERLINQNQPCILSDVELYHSLNNNFISNSLSKQKIQSYIAVPLMDGDNPLGFLELASPRKYELNTSSLTKLEDVLPILSMAVVRYHEEAKNKIEAIIQQECTTIHPSVKWIFEEEAYKYMVEEYNGNEPTFKDIVLKDVFPLYGQLDIKSSSTLRNEAVKKDLMKQMNAVHKLLEKAMATHPMPALEELSFRVKSYSEEIANGLLAGSEHKILGFLRKEIYPVFNHLESLDSNLAKSIKKYSNMLNPDLHMIYDARRKFDESVMLTNQTLASFIDKKQVEAQAMFPHYFERYKTDGLEFNIYIGQSIAQNLEFNSLYLNNLRLWQLIVMCEMENEFYRLQKEMPAPLEVASLVLVYNTSLSIQFRMDEKQFDVEGAYNARYEIVKKRVDKAHIKGTDERVTVPGKIAIIYTGDQDYHEYQKYLRFLANRNYITGKIEELDLEDLQGITGLKALRVEVNYSQSKQEKISYEDIIEAIGQG